MTNSVAGQVYQAHPQQADNWNDSCAQASFAYDGSWLTLNFEVNYSTIQWAESWLPNTIDFRVRELVGLLVRNRLLLNLAGRLPVVDSARRRRARQHTFTEQL